MPRSLLLLTIYVASLCWGQNPYSVAPSNYKLEFENELVRISRVTYRPGDRIPIHDHPPVNTIYVYLTDGGAVRFGHQQFAPTTRPPVKAGAVRFAQASKETHNTEYLGEQRSEYLRIELKTAAPRKFRTQRIAAGETSSIDNEQALIERLNCLRGCAAITKPSVTVRLDKGTGKFVKAGKRPPRAANLIRVVLKTGPIS